MPYELRKTGPKSKPWCVYNKVTGAKKGCSATEEMAKKFMSKLYVEEGKKEMEVDLETKAVWTTAFVNDLPDSCFLYVEAGGKKEDGKTKPRSLRHLPYKDASGKVDLPHLRNAISRLGQPKTGTGGDGWLTEALRKRLLARARKLLAAHGGKKELESYELKEVTETYLVIEDAEGLQFKVAYSISDDGEFSLVKKEGWLEFKDVSLSDQSRRVRKAFYNKFGGDSSTYLASYWVTEVFEGYLIVEDYADYELYKVAYTEGDDGYEFAEKEDWKKVEVEYVEKASIMEEEIQKDSFADKVKQLWEKVFPPESMPLFITKQQEDGQFRWVTISSTAFLDGEEEIISTKALANNQPIAEKDYGEWRFWHTKGIKLGNCDFQMFDGVCLVESGLWDDNEIANPIRKAIDKDPKEWKVSIGFAPLQDPIKNVLIKSTLVKKVWDAIQIKERGPLPKKYAANQFACIVTEGGITVDKKKEKVLRELLGDDLATQVITNVDELNQKALDEDAVVKGQETPVVESAPDPTPEPTPEKMITKEELTEVLKELKSLPDKFKKLEEDLQKLKDDVAPKATVLRASEDTSTSVSPTEVEKLVGPVELKAIEEIVDTLLGNI